MRRWCGLTNIPRYLAWTQQKSTHKCDTGSPRRSLNQHKSPPTPQARHPLRTAKPSAGNGYGS